MPVPLILQRQLYSKEELNEFLEYVKEDLDLNWYTYFRLLAYSGARKSELLALKWSDIDFDTFYTQYQQNTH